ncbi:nitric oxide synthase oxygenase [Nocardia camponoti]|uniref:Nitric oxide synthase oxygenase n=1 Tax=Nocardia camponoti TaxID=1616106 RepID=A0A917QV05_9NOCA|nr:nitric oxide synthase oxygenase [Nocardia camponoti]GGK69462.1 nitric oxide synthase oxygenase [Nocardia camponoti]
MTRALLDPKLDIERRLRECDEFFRSPELAHIPAQRRTSALRQLSEEGTYRQTAEEILLGAKLAWRNHARCVGRKHWRALKLLDARRVTTAAELADVCWQHLRLATNGGAIQSMITVGPQQGVDGSRFQIMSSQLIRYAGYRNGDGTVTGDPANIDATEHAVKLGWEGAGTPYDVLPVVIETPDEEAQYFDVPKELVQEVPLSHPDFPWFAELGLKWHALPAVSNMDLEVGGITYPFAPFNGWYVGTEIGARNLSDTDRYNMLPLIADMMGLDTSSVRTLWRDKALIELNHAVLHSFRTEGVHMVDHHTVAKQFCDHVAREEAAGRKCPTDWTWINPPISSGLTPTFHRYYDDPDMEVRPNFVKRV